MSFIIDTIVFYYNLFFRYLPNETPVKESDVVKWAYTLAMFAGLLILWLGFIELNWLLDQAEKNKRNRIDVLDRLKSITDNKDLDQ